MSRNNPSVGIQLRQLIYYQLDNDFTQNALFLAGRLHGLEPRNPDASHLLALCHLRCGRLKAAYDYSKDKGAHGKHLGCAYVFAQACLGLERFGDGVAALERARGLWGGRNNWNKHSETSRRHLPDAAAVNCLLGKLLRAHGQPKKASDCFIEALKLNPFMWDAFTALCDSGTKVKPSNIFRMTPEMQAFFSNNAHSVTVNGHMEISSPQHHAPANRFSQQINTPGNDPFNPTSRPGDNAGLGSNVFASRLNGNLQLANGGGNMYADVETPIPNGSQNDEGGGGAQTQQADMPVVQPPHAPLRRTRTFQSIQAEADAPKMKPMLTRHKQKNSTESAEIPEGSKRLAPGSKRTVTGHSRHAANSAEVEPRRSARLFSQLSQMRPSGTRSAASKNAESDAQRRELRKAKATGVKGRTTAASTVGRVVSGNRKPVEVTDHNLKDARPPSVPAASVAPPTKVQPPPVDNSRDQEALQWILDLLIKLGYGYYHLSRYQCKEALQAYMSAPTSQRETPWVMAQMGKAQYEMSKYSQAAATFSKVLKMAPSRMEDMEVYSTVLWHLKEDVKLAHLSYELMDQERLSPEAWCALGNCFSLQREHDQAIKCFTRAAQLDPGFAYAYTLQGHEHIANEEYDKALYSYRCAISADHRHYNGWYGLARVYEKMGKYDIAEKHYKSAAQINPSNAVLAVRIGVVQERLGKLQAALIQYTHACDLDPRSALSRFKKAHALMKLRQLDSALAELEVLKDIAPDEANVHFMLGRLYKMMREKASAIRHFTIALNLDPRASQYIKEAMESLEDDEYEEYGDEDGP